MKQTTRERFPIIIKKGCVTVKIYRVKDREGYNYTVTYKKPTGRKKKTFADLEEAKGHAKTTANSLAHGDHEAVKLGGADRHIYVEAKNAIQPTGLSLDSVAREFASAFNILGGAHIVEAARYYKQHVDVALSQITAADAVARFRGTKEAEGVSAAYLHDIDVLLGDFADTFHCQLSSIQPDDLRDYLNAKKVSLVSKENRRRLLVVLFNFGKAQGWLRKNEESAADVLGAYKPKQREVEIYTPNELSKLLNAADADFLPYIALIAFGGVRREELCKGLLWESINFDRKTITVPAAIAKTGRKRKIDMQGNLIEWLEPYRMKSGTIFNKSPRRRIEKIVKATGMTWKRNALRHSFGSYRMEQTKNEGLVALEMGNSPKVVKDHYFEIVDDRAAREYWSLKPLPEGERKIVSMS